MYDDVGLNPTLRLETPVLVYLVRRGLKPALKTFGVSVGLSSKPNIVHLSHAHRVTWE